MSTQQKAILIGWVDNNWREFGKGERKKGLTAETKKPDISWQTLTCE